MNVVPLSAVTGRDLGTSNSRRLRLGDRIPATVYGMGTDPSTLTVERAELRRALSTPAGVNALIELKFDGTAQYTLVKEIQRHPVRRDPIHIDFLRIDPETPMELTIPIIMTGEAKSVTSNGGMVEQQVQQLKVSVRPDAIPNEFYVDITDLEIDSSITVGDLVLPDGCTTDADTATPIVVGLLTRAAMVATRTEDGEAAPDDAAGTADA